MYKNPISSLFSLLIFSLFFLLPQEMFENHVEYIPQKNINAYSYGNCGYTWQSGDFVVHFAGPIKKNVTLLDSFIERNKKDYPGLGP